MATEHELMQDLLENARGVLHHYGIDKERFDSYMTRMDETTQGILYLREHEEIDDE
jgi:hypothetical protein